MNIEKILRVEPEPLERSRRKKSRIFIWDADKSIAEQVANRNTRRLEEFVDLIPQAVEMAGLKPAQAYEFHNRVCTCGVSPGFMADTWLRDERNIPFDLHITVSRKVTKPQVVNTKQQEPEPNEDKPVDSLRAIKIAALVKARAAKAAKRAALQSPEERVPFAAKRSYVRRQPLMSVPRGEMSRRRRRKETAKQEG